LIQNGSQSWVNLLKSGAGKDNGKHFDDWPVVTHQLFAAELGSER
jgi:hypothetical protein